MKTSPRSFLTAGMLFALCSTAGADFTITPPMMHSAGLRGNAGNSVYLYTYTGPDAVVTGGEFAGSISSIIRGTTIAEARWGIRNTRFAGTTSVSFSHNLGYFENSVLVLGKLGGGMILKSGDVLRLETFESFDDGPGSDAVWNHVSWTFATAIPKSLGTFTAVTSLTTSGGAAQFGTDTEIGLYDANGVLLAYNDDFGSTSGSGLTGLSLADGVYYLCVMPWDAAATNGVVRPGFAGIGDYTLSVNGVAKDTGTLAAYSTVWYTFTVGEAPPPCAADFNGDGSVDFFDYDDFVVCFEGGTCPSGVTADYNGDTAVDFFDYDDFVVAFEAGC